jgi:hypothetical protein
VPLASFFGCVILESTKRDATARCLLGCLAFAPVIPFQILFSSNHVDKYFTFLFHHSTNLSINQVGRKGNPVYPRPKGQGFSLSLDLKLPSSPV